MELSSTFFLITLAVYCAALVLYMWNLVGKSGLISRSAYVTALLGLAMQTAGIVARGIEQHRTPTANLFESLVLIAWLLVAIYLVSERKYRISALGVLVSLVAFVSTATYITILSRLSDGPLPGQLQSGWRDIHVVSNLISYASFVLAFGAAVGYLIQEHMLKAKRITIFQKHLPPLDVMDHLAYKMVALGFPMLTLGVITGSLWAQTAWGNYWSWDPKETWSLITWLVYAAYLHVRIAQGWRGKWANRLLITGFVCVLITYLGVNLLSHGKHSYNW